MLTYEHTCKFFCEVQFLTSIIVQQDAAIYSLLYFCKLLLVFNICGSERHAL